MSYLSNVQGMSDRESHPWTPLILAINNDCWDVADDLIESGADVHVACAYDKTTAIHSAAASGRPGLYCLEKLVGRGCDVNARDTDGVTALYLACGVDPAFGDASERAIRALVDAGAEINAVADHGSTALHVAAASLQTAIVRLLLWLGADETIKNNKGDTPADMAGLVTWIDAVENTDNEGKTPPEIRRIWRYAMRDSEDMSATMHALKTAPSDRAWRRRSCWALCRFKCSNSLDGSVGSNAASVVAWVVCLTSDDVFKSIIGFL